MLSKAYFIFYKISSKFYFGLVSSSLDLIFIHSFIFPYQCKPRPKHLYLKLKYYKLYAHSSLFILRSTVVSFPNKFWSISISSIGLYLCLQCLLYKMISNFSLNGLADFFHRNITILYYL